MRIDGCSVERHALVPVDRGESGKLLAQQVDLVVDAIQGCGNVNLPSLRSELWRRRISKVATGLRNGGIEEEPHSEEDFPDVIRVLTDGPHPIHGSSKQIIGSHPGNGRSPLRRKALDCCDRARIAPIIRVESALSTPLDVHAPDSAPPARSIPPPGDRGQVSTLGTRIQGVPFRSVDGGTQVLRKSRVALLERSMYNATSFPCRDRVLSSSSDRWIGKMRQSSDHSSRNRRKADSSQPLGSWKSAGRLRIPRSNALPAQTHHEVSRNATVSARSSRRSSVAW